MDNSKYSAVSPDETKEETEEYEEEHEIINELQNNDDTKLEIFKRNKYDYRIICGLAILGVLGIVLIIICSNYYYGIIACIGYVVSVFMATSLNSDKLSVTQRIVTLTVSYCILLTIFFVFSLVNVAISTYITVIALGSSWIIIIIMFCFEYAKYGKDKMKLNKEKVMETLTQLWDVKVLILPVFAHFADIGTDIGTSFVYYQRSISNDQSDETGIHYKSIFWTSIFILLFYRFIGTVIIGYYTRSFIDALLQYFDFFLIKTLSVEWKLHYEKAGRVHQFIGLIEGIFESGPQSIISMYIIIADNHKSFLIWVSTLFSIVSIASRSISQDQRFFSDDSNAKEIDFNREDGCKCNKHDGRCMYCNYPYLMRIIWRLMDVTSYILFCAILWHSFGGHILYIWLGAQFGLVIVLLVVGWCDDRSINIYWLNGLLAISPTPWNSDQPVDQVSFIFGMSRIIINLGLMVTICIYNPYDTLSCINLSLMISSFLMYIWFTGPRDLFVGPRGCCGWGCSFGISGNKWVNTSVVTTLSIVGCNDMTEIRQLIDEGVDIKQYLKAPETWDNYPRPHDLIILSKEYEHDLARPKKNYFESIACNENLDKDINSEQIEMVITELQQFSIITERNRKMRVVECACLHHQDILWIDAFIEKGVSYDNEKCMKRAEQNKDAGGKSKILKYLETKK